METDARLKKKAGVVSSSDNGTSYLTDLETGSVYEINETADLILNLLDEGRRPTQVQKIMIKRFPDVPVEEIQRDLAAVIEHFLRAGILEPRGVNKRLRGRP